MFCCQWDTYIIYSVLRLFLLNLFDFLQLWLSKNPPQFCADSANDNSVGAKGGRKIPPCSFHGFGVLLWCYPDVEHLANPWFANNVLRGDSDAVQFLRQELNSIFQQEFSVILESASDTDTNTMLLEEQRRIIGFLGSLREVLDLHFSCTELSWECAGEYFEGENLGVFRRTTWLQQKEKSEKLKRASKSQCSVADGQDAHQHWARLGYAWHHEKGWMNRGC